MDTTVTTKRSKPALEKDDSFSRRKSNSNSNVTNSNSKSDQRSRRLRQSSRSKPRSNDITTVRDIKARCINLKNVTTQVMIRKREYHEQLTEKTALIDKLQNQLSDSQTQVLNLRSQLVDHEVDTMNRITNVSNELAANIAKYKDECEKLEKIIQLNKKEAQRNALKISNQLNNSREIGHKNTKLKEQLEHQKVELKSLEQSVELCGEMVGHAARNCNHFEKASMCCFLLLHNFVCL